MWYPIARIKRDKNEKGEPTGEHKYVLINALTNEERIMTNAEVKRSNEDIKSDEDIRGFNNNGLNSYYSDLPYVGEGEEEQEHCSDVNYYTLIKKNYYRKKEYYTAVSVTDKRQSLYIFDKDQLKELVGQGHKIAGAKIMGGILKISKELKENYIGK